jgi:UDP-glucose 4-epimerase
VVRTAKAVTGRKIPVERVGRRAGDPAVLLADVRRAEEALGWRAERDLATTVADAWRWRLKLHAAEGAIA